MKLLTNLLLIFILFAGKAGAQIAMKSKMDSIAVIELQGINTKIDSLLQKEHFGQAEVQKIDSLLTKKTDFIKKLDSLQQLPNQFVIHIDSLVTGKLKKLVNKLDNARSKVTRYQDKAKKIPGSNYEGDAIPSRLGGKVEKLKGKAAVLSEKEKLTVPAVHQDFEKIQPPEDYQQEFDNLKGLSNKQLQEVKRIKAIKHHADRYREMTETADTYKKEIQGIASGDSGKIENLSKKLGQQAESLKEIESFKSETAEFEEARKLAEQLKKEKYLKDKARNQVQELARGGLAKFQDKIKGAQQTMTKFKKKYASVPSSSDMSKATKRNSLAGKPLGERVTLGGNFQILRGNPIAADLSPLIGFRWTKKWLLGIGGTYRVTLSQENKLSYLVDQDVMGYQSFAEYRLIKGFYLHGSFERMATRTDPKVEDESWQWVNGGLAGLGKSYRLTKKIKGNALILYNFFYESGKSPYPRAWMIKMGFQLNNLSALKKE